MVQDARNNSIPIDNASFSVQDSLYSMFFAGICSSWEQDNPIQFIPILFLINATRPGGGEAKKRVDYIPVFFLGAPLK